MLVSLPLFLACSSVDSSDEPGPLADVPDGATAEPVEPDASLPEAGLDAAAVPDAPAPIDADAEDAGDPSRRVKALAAGWGFTCALTEAGTVRCWGSNRYGQLGDGTRSPSSSPVLVEGVSDAVAITAGDGFACALLQDATVRCWGANARGQLGRGYTSEDEVLAGALFELSGVTAVVAEGAHACALKSGEVWCWGNNLHGETGIDPAVYGGSSLAQKVAGLENVVTLGLGTFHSCASTSLDTKCWGLNNTTQLGSSGGDTFAPRSTITTLAPVQLVADEEHTVALLASGKVYGWGLRSSGAIGYFGNLIAEIDDLYDVVAIGTGWQHTCALSAGRVRCGGSNPFGQLGRPIVDEGRTDFQFRPVGELPSNIAGLGIGTLHSCAFAATGEVYCWGANQEGELGTATPAGALDHAERVIGFGQ